MDKQDDNDYTAEEPTQRRDALLLKLLKTPPQPRPKRKRAGSKPRKSEGPSAKPKKQAARGVRK